MNRRTLLAAMPAATLTGAVTAQTMDVEIRPLVFQSSGMPMAGRLYRPLRMTGRLPAIVVTGAWFTVKEQMAGRYAQELTRRGFAAMTFDFRGFGESGSSLRQRETPADKTADILAAVESLATMDGVDAGRLGGLGICASSGYMIAAACDSPKLKAVALVAPWLHDRDIVLATYGGDAGVQALIAQGDAAKAALQSTGKQTFVLAASTTDRNAVMFDVPYYTETDRGMIPAWRNEIDPAFWQDWLTFDAIANAPRLRQPIAIVHSEAAAIPIGAHRFYDRVQAPKSQRWLDGVSQFDFYDRDPAVTIAVDTVADHYRRNL